MEPLQSTEINAVLEKLRAEYSENAKKNPKLFDLKAFESRLMLVLQQKGSLTNFLKEEIKFIDALKAKHKELEDKKQAAKGDTINKILEEQEARLKKYQRIDFHPLAKPEIRYFYGAILSFAETELPALIYVFKGTPEYSAFKDTIPILERMGISRRGLPSIRINEHVKALLDANGNQSAMEKDGQAVLKEVCIALKGIVTSVRECMEKNRVSQTLSVKLDEREFPKAAESYQNLVFGVALEKIVLRAETIIRDFRMAEITGLGQG
ncbi:hypothetical protein EHQ12_12180 [Leptospira gomenensis]|uniref:Uncharacterized protein n=1 Tax=Leptospira gomenensis TaxID=2484974 RepID=A0A5F1Y9R6_9LEPT|nr:hypothetical protein [Leptospira gomenensis]TGK32693.1 hypothetical protein EHQ17_12025 [Leptospira gomenensis]TGK36841.1 hypothetical protein EHQ12_12180 [Leptospira gomenensis]TGK39916.1 hypothetical protein EHQ07_19480 [Leptospira gomenensis]TGK58051.1 hypothetical protein EHQ13_14380 [Leptospira gomenensis]